VKALFRKAVVAVYWLALPISLLVCAGWLIGAVMNPSDLRSWMMAAGAGVFCGVVAWRLWLNSQALGWAGATPGHRRLLLVVLPFLILALAGVAVATLGVVWLAAGIWLVTGSEPATSGYRDLVSGPTLPIVGGALLILVGAALGVPLLRSLRRKAEAPDPH